MLMNRGPVEEAVLEDQAGVWGAAQDFGPGGEDGGIELVVGGETAEGEVAVREEGGRGDVGDGILDLEGEVRARNAQDGFGKVRFIGGVDYVGVADEVVVGGDAGGCVKVEPADNDRRRLAGDEGEAAEFAVAIEINEDVEVQLFDAISRFVIGQGGDVKEVVGGVVLVAGASGARSVGEEVELEAGAVVVVEQAPDRLHPMVGLEKGGEVADAEGHGFRGGFGGPWRRESGGEVLAGGKNVAGGGGGIGGDGGGESGEGMGVAIEFVGGVEVLNGRFDVTELEKSLGVVVEARDVVGLESQGVAPAFQGGGEFLQLKEGAAGAVPGGEVAGGVLEGFVVGGERFFGALLGEEDIAVEGVEFSGGGVCPEGGAAGLFGFREAVGQEMIPGGFERGHSQ